LRTLTYPTPAVRPGSVYAARARLTLGDRLLFTTTQRNSVDPLNPSPIELVVDAVATDSAPPTPDVCLTNTYWKFIEALTSPARNHHLPGTGPSSTGSPRRTADAHGQIAAGSGANPKQLRPAAASMR
jgi:hypothetical protein